MNKDVGMGMSMACVGNSKESYLDRERKVCGRHHRICLIGSWRAQWIATQRIRRLQELFWFCPYWVGSLHEVLQSLRVLAVVTFTGGC